MFAAAAPAILSAVTAAGAVAQGVGGFMQGRADAKAAETNAVISETRADQQDTQLRSELEANLGAVRAARAANGLTFSPTGNAIAGAFEDESARTRRILRQNELERARQFRANSLAARRGGALSLFGGVTKAGASIFQYQAGP